MIGFANWLIRHQRLAANQFSDVPRVDIRSDRRRERRSLRVEELRRLLLAAKERPLAEAETVRRGPRKGRRIAEVSDERRNELERLGWERALIYKTLALTGLRRGELASVKIGQLDLGEEAARVRIHAADEKAGRGAEIPLRPDLARELREWREQKRLCFQNTVGFVNDSWATTPLFNVPEGLVRIFDRDLKFAGIPKRDSDGRTLDVHALRLTFGTHLSEAGVAPRTAQAALRHSSIDLTMNVYTDPRLLDVAAAIETLPDLPIAEESTVGPRSKLAPLLAPNVVDSSQTQSIPDKTTAESAVHRNNAEESQVQKNGPLAASQAGPVLEPPIRFERTTCSLRMNCSTN